MFNLPGGMDLILYDRRLIYKSKGSGDGVASGPATLAGPVLGSTSPDSSAVAVSPAHGATVHIFPKTWGQAEVAPAGVFSAPLDGNLPMGEGDAITRLAWSHDSSCLAAATQEGNVYTIAESGQLIGEWAGRKTWGRGVLDICFGGASTCIYLLSSRGVVFTFGRIGVLPRQLMTLKAQHPKASCMTFDHSTSELVIAGPGAGKQPSAAPRLTGWHVPPKGSPTPAWQHGEPASAGWFWSSGGGPGAWSLVASPAFSRLALLRPGRPASVLDVQALRTGAGSKGALTDLRIAAQHAAWWGESALASCSGGACSVQDLSNPSAVNLLTPKPPLFPEGTAVACQVAGPGGGWRLLAVAVGQEKGEWSIWALEESPAQEKLGQLLMAEQWDAALLLAETHNLDTDQVRRALWERQDVCAATIQGYWGAITNRRRAIESCLERRASSHTGQRLLLEAGLKEILDKLNFDQEVEMSEENLGWLALRIRLLQHLDRLSLLTNMLQRPYSPSGFSQMRDLSLTSLAADFARASDMESLRALLAACPFTLTPRLLDVLDSLSETTPAAEYADLIREVASRDAPELQRPADPAESRRTVEHLRAAGEFAILVATEPLASLALSWQPPSKAAVARWFVQRAKQVDLVTGSFSATLEVVDVGMKLVGEAHSEMLQTLRSRIQELQTAASIEGGSIWNLRLARYAPLDLAGRLALLVEDSHLNSLAEDRRRLAAVLDGLPRGERDAALRGLLTREADARLPWCCRFFKEEAAELQAFESATGGAEAALACIYAHTGVVEWELLRQTAGHAQAILEQGEHAAGGQEEGWGGEDGDTSDVDNLSERVSEAQRLIQGAELLVTLDIPQTLAELQQATPESAMDTARTMFARLVRQQPPESRWTEMWKHVKELQQTAWPCLTKQQLLGEMCRSLLADGQWKLARSYLTGTGSTRIPSQTAEELVLSAARDYFYSASTLDAPEIYKAQRCLGVLPNNAAAAAELRAYQAVLSLHEFGLDMLPMQFLQVEDRMDIMQEVLDARPGAYARGESLEDLAEKLGLGRRNPRLRLQVANKALLEGDVAEARRRCLGLVREGQRAAWELAAQLALLGKGSGGSPPAEEAKELLGFAIAHCHPDQVLNLLQLWHDAEWHTPTQIPEVVHDLLATLSPGRDARHRALPHFGDTAMALDCLLQTKDWEQDLNGALEQSSGSYRTQRQLMLLGLFISAFKVGTSGMTDPSRYKEDAEVAKELLRQPPWELLSRFSNRDRKQSQDPAVTAMEAWSGRLGDAADERRMDTWMPGFAGGMSGESGASSSQGDREAALRDVARRAGAAAGKEDSQMGRALVLARRYQVGEWGLHCCYLEGLLLEGNLEGHSLQELATSALKPLTEHPQEASQHLYNSVYLALDPSQHARLATCLRLLAECLESPKAEACSASAEFTEACGRLCPEADARLLVSPLVTHSTASTLTAASTAEIQAEVATHITVDCAKEFAAAIAALQTAAAAAGLDLGSSPWPSSSVICLLAFCHEIGQGRGSELGQHYVAAAGLLSSMAAPEIAAAVEFVALGSPAPTATGRRLGLRAPRAVRLQALQDGSSLLAALEAPDAAVIDRFQSAAALLERVEEAASAADLQPKEQDAVERALKGAAEGCGPQEAASQLLALGSPMARILQVIGSLSEEEEEEATDSIVLQAMDASITSALKGLDGDAITTIGSVVRSLEEGDSQLLKPFRDLTWQQLQSFVLSATAGAGRQEMVQLLASVLPQDQQIARWQAWEPPAEGDGTASAAKLWMQSLALLQRDWPEAELQPGNFTSLAAAQATFMRLLAAALGLPQLEVLGHLLAGVWQDGDAFMSPKDLPRAGRAKVRRSSKRQESGRAEQTTQDSQPGLPAAPPQGAPAEQSQPAAEQANEGWVDEAGGDWGADLELPDLGLGGIPMSPAAPTPQPPEGKASPRSPRGEPGEADHGVNGIPDDSAAGEGWEGGEDLGLDLGSPAHPSGGGGGAATAVEGVALVDGEGWATDDQAEAATVAQGRDAPSDSLGLAVQNHGLAAARSDPNGVGGESGREAAGVAGAESGLGVGAEGLEGQPEAGEDAQEASSGGEEGDEEEGVSPLHACWEALLERQLAGGGAAAVLRRVDMAEGRLVTEEEGKRLVTAANSLGFEEGCILALLLPDSEVQESATADLASREVASCPPSTPIAAALLLAVAAKGLLSALPSCPSFPGLCEQLLSQPCADSSWTGMLLPACLAQLVLAGHWEYAATLITWHLRLHPLFRDVNSGLLLLPRFFQAHLRIKQQATPWRDDAPLPKTAAALWQSLPGLYGRALKILKAN